VPPACTGDGIGLAYTTAYDTASHIYRTTAVAASGIAPPCEGLGYTLTLSGAAGVLATSSGTVALVAGTLTVVPASPPDAGTVTSASLVITG